MRQKALFGGAFFHIRMLPSAGELVHYRLVFFISVWATSPRLTVGNNGKDLPSCSPTSLTLNASCSDALAAAPAEDTASKRYLWLLCKALKTKQGYLSPRFLQLSTLLFPCTAEELCSGKLSYVAANTGGYCTEVLNKQRVQDRFQSLALNLIS